MHTHLSASLHMPVTTRGVCARRSDVDLEQRYFSLSLSGSILSPRDNVMCFIESSISGFNLVLLEKAFTKLA